MKRRPPSYYKPYTYTKKRWLVMVQLWDDQVVPRVYTGTHKWVARTVAGNRNDVMKVLSCIEISEDAFRLFLYTNPDSKYSTTRQLVLKKTTVTKQAKQP